MSTGRWAPMMTCEHCDGPISQGSRHVLGDGRVPHGKCLAIPGCPAWKDGQHYYALAFKDNAVAVAIQMATGYPPMPDVKQCRCGATVEAIKETPTP